MARAASLFERARQGQWRFLVIPARALLRRVMPPDVIRASGAHIVLESELDLTDFARKLSEGGRRHIAERFGPAALEKRLERILARVLG